MNGDEEVNDRLHYENLEEAIQVIGNLKQRIRVLETETARLKQENFDLKQRLRPSKEIKGYLLKKVYESLAYCIQRHPARPAKTDEVYEAYCNACKASLHPPAKRQTVWRRLLELEQNGRAKRSASYGVEYWTIVGE